MSLTGLNHFDVQQMCFWRHPLTGNQIIVYKMLTDNINAVGMALSPEVVLAGGANWNVVARLAPERCCGDTRTTSRRPLAVMYSLHLSIPSRQHVFVLAGLQFVILVKALFVQQPTRQNPLYLRYGKPVTRMLDDFHAFREGTNDVDNCWKETRVGAEPALPWRKVEFLLTDNNGFEPEHRAPHSFHTRFGMLGS